MSARLDDDRLLFGPWFALSLQRTLRVPESGGPYKLPAGLGRLPILRAHDYRARVPRAWRDGDFFVPMYQREALWLGFDSSDWRPIALKVGVGGIDALTGDAWDLSLSVTLQNYLVSPPQSWLDGIHAGVGIVRQFVAMPLGSGHTVEEQLTGAAHGGLRVAAFESKPGRFPDRPPPPRDDISPASMPFEGMGMGGGGTIEQKIYADPHGADTWDSSSVTEAVIHIVNSRQYTAITRRDAPEPPIDAQLYAEYGIPWFDLDDERETGIAPSQRLGHVKSIGEIDSERTGRRDDDDCPIDVDTGRVRKIRPARNPRD